MKGNDVTKHGECLTEETLTDYLEGSLDSVVQAVCEAHLITCDPCRQNLAMVMRVLQPQVTPEEEIAVADIANAWAERHSRTVPLPKTVLGKRGGYALAAAAALLLVIGATWMTWRWKSTPDSAHELVQAILSKDRPFPTQLSGEPHVPMFRNSENGSGMDFDSLSAEMSQRAASQYDIGRFHLIRKNFPKAIAALEDAAKDPKATAAVHNDLGVAYMEQRVPENMARAEAEFHTALQLDSRFAPAVFNLCLFYDRAIMPEKAKQERELYLRLDPTSGWADEVRLKLLP